MFVTDVSLQASSHFVMLHLGFTEGEIFMKRLHKFTLPGAAGR
jgi:hypothetical protein